MPVYNNKNIISFNNLLAHLQIVNNLIQPSLLNFTHGETMPKLNRQILLNICRYLDDPQDVISMSSVCLDWRNWLNDDILWERLTLARFGLSSYNSLAPEIVAYPSLPLYDTYTYSHEEQIIAAVWMHEYMKGWKKMWQLRTDFRQKFGKPAPPYHLLIAWKGKLFLDGGSRLTEMCGWRKAFVHKMLSYDNVRKETSIQSAVTNFEETSQYEEDDLSGAIDNWHNMTYTVQQCQIFDVRNIQFIQNSVLLCTRDDFSVWDLNSGKIVQKLPLAINLWCPNLFKTVYNKVFVLQHLFLEVYTMKNLKFESRCVIDRSINVPNLESKFIMEWYNKIINMKKVIHWSGDCGEQYFIGAVNYGTDENTYLHAWDIQGKTKTNAVIDTVFKTEIKLFGNLCYIVGETNLFTYDVKSGDVNKTDIMFTDPKKISITEKYIICFNKERKEKTTTVEIWNSQKEHNFLHRISFGATSPTLLPNAHPYCSCIAFRSDNNLVTIISEETFDVLNEFRLGSNLTEMKIITPELVLTENDFVNPELWETTLGKGKKIGQFPHAIHSISAFSLKAYILECENNYIIIYKFLQ